MANQNIENIFRELAKCELEEIYKKILEGRESGMRPRALDPYIYRIQEKYPLSTREAWDYAERSFWEEVARRYFQNIQ